MVSLLTHLGHFLLKLLLLVHSLKIISCELVYFYVGILFSTSWEILIFDVYEQILPAFGVLAFFRRHLLLGTGLHIAQDVQACQTTEVFKITF